MAKKLPFLERNLRRLRVYGGRAARSAGLPGPRHPCLFMHMPKCGGTSISEAMYATVPLGRGVTVLDAVSTRRAAAMLAHGRDEPSLCHEDLSDPAPVFALREGMMLQAMAWGSLLIHGHVLYSERAEAHFGDCYRLVTLFRDPIERTISNYRMARRNGVTGDGLDVYLDSPLARTHGQVYLRYLSGRAMVAPGEEGEALDVALARLGRFAVVGFLDDLPGFLRRYRAAFGVPLAVRNYNQGSGEAPDLRPAQREKLAALCAADQAIFDRARSMA